MIGGGVGGGCRPGAVSIDGRQEDLFPMLFGVYANLLLWTIGCEETMTQPPPILFLHLPGW